MTTQPEALRLAEELEIAIYGERNANQQKIAQAATELRRLHDEVQQLKSDLSEEVLISNEMLEVKDELLAAVKYLTEYSQQHGVMPAALTTARAAINKAEGGQK